MHMPPKKNPSHKGAKPGLRMNELVKATGVAKSTILHYVNEGLLPQPPPRMSFFVPVAGPSGLSVGLAA